MGECNLYMLLDLDPENKDDREKLDADAIIKEVQKNPWAAESMYAFTFTGNRLRCLPLHQAIILRAPINVIDALCSPIVLRIERDALRYRNGFDPKEKYTGQTALHLALEYEASLDLVLFFLEKQPDVIQKKTINAYTPLHTACRYKAPMDIVALLLDKWPEASRLKSNHGHTPLHIACASKASFEVVSLLLASWPDASKEKTLSGSLPLHMACHNDAPFQVVLLLLDIWLDSKENRNRNSVNALRNDDASADTQNLVYHLSILFNDNDMNSNASSSPEDIMNFFITIKWWLGAVLVFERHPYLTQSFDLHTKVKADVLFMVGRYCRLTTMWEVIRNEHDLFPDVA